MTSEEANLLFERTKGEPPLSAGGRKQCWEIDGKAVLIDRKGDDNGKFSKDNKDTLEGFEKLKSIGVSIPSVYYAGEFDGKPAMIQEFVQGEPLYFSSMVNFRNSRGIGGDVPYREVAEMLLSHNIKNAQRLLEDGAIFEKVVRDILKCNAVGGVTLDTTTAENFLLGEDGVTLIDVITNPDQINLENANTYSERAIHNAVIQIRDVVSNFIQSNNAVRGTTEPTQQEKAILSQLSQKCKALVTQITGKSFEIMEPAVSFGNVNVPNYGERERVFSPEQHAKNLALLGIRSEKQR